MSLLDLLFQFLSRLAFGLSFVMVFGIPQRQVPSGFFRNHLYVLLGLNVLATLIAFNQPDNRFWYNSLAAAIASYLGSVAWLYEKARLGRFAILAVMAFSMTQAWYSASPLGSAFPPDAWLLIVAMSSGLLLGMTIAAMFLGHYYLNSPTMRLEPLRGLVGGIFIVVAARTIVSAMGVESFWAARDSLVGLDWALFAMHWLGGLVAPLGIAWMAWQTLKIPNTQSATGILYVGVILVFLGELAALVLSGKLGHPV